MSSCFFVVFDFENILYPVTQFLKGTRHRAAGELRMWLRPTHYRKVLFQLCTSLVCQLFFPPLFWKWPGKNFHCCFPLSRYDGHCALPPLCTFCTKAVWEGKSSALMREVTVSKGKYLYDTKDPWTAMAAHTIAPTYFMSQSDDLVLSLSIQWILKFFSLPRRCLFVDWFCWLVCQQDYKKTIKHVSTKLGWKMGVGQE